eukprot:3711511-Amphidinium_carterae.1
MREPPRSTQEVRDCACVFPTYIGVTHDKLTLAFLFRGWQDWGQQPRGHAPHLPASGLRN